MALPDVAQSVHVLLIDGLNIIRRVYAGVPGESDSDMHFEASCKQIVASVRKALRRHKPTHAALVFDGEGESWRKEQFAGYKAGRTPMPERLRRGLAQIRTSIDDIGVKTLDVDGYEADDTIATMALAIASPQRRVTVLSSDKHFGQIVGDWVVAYDHFTDRIVDTDAVIKRFGVTPEQLATLFALTGDSGVSVPGVKGVGPKTGCQLIKQHHDLDAILASAADREDAVGRRLREQASEARFAYHLLSLRLDIPVGVNLKELRLTTTAEH